MKKTRTSCLLLSLILFFSASIWTPKPASSGTKKMPHEIEGIHLSADWQSSVSVLVVTYRIENKSDHDILIFDRLVGEDGVGPDAISSETAFVEFGENGTLILSKMVPALPEDFDVPSPIVPYARRLAPGSGIDGQVVVKVPISANRPYPFGGEPAATSKFDSGVLKIGFAKLETDAPFRQHESLGETVFFLPHYWASQRQNILSTSPHPLDLIVD